MIVGVESTGTVGSLFDVLDVDVLTDRRVRDHLSELVLHGFLTVSEQNDGFHGGSSYEYELNVELSLIISVLEETGRVTEITDHVVTTAK